MEAHIIPPTAFPTRILTPAPQQNKIRLECKKRRIRLNDFFTTFDRLHTKRCTKSQFYRALTISNVSLTKDEVDMLVNRYEVPADMMPDGKSDMVNYKKFCDQIDKVRVGFGRQAKRSDEDVSLLLLLLASRTF